MLVVVVALYPTNTTNKEKIYIERERHSAEKKRWNWIEFSCRPGVLYITAFLSNNNIKKRRRKKEKKRKNIQAEKRNRLALEK